MLDRSWLRIFRVLFIAAALATGAPTLIRDFMLLGGHATTSPTVNYWTWLRICAVISFVVVWVQEHWRVKKLEEKLRPKLRIPANIYEQPWLDSRGQCVSYYFDVFNDSIGSTVGGIEVRLAEINPSVIPYLPIPLHIKHDNTPQQKLDFSLNPLDKKQIDLVSSVQGSSVINVVAVGVQIDVPAGRYTLTVTASGRDLVPAVAKFEAWVDDTGYLRCVAPSSGNSE